MPKSAIWKIQLWITIMAQPKIFNLFFDNKIANATIKLMISTSGPDLNMAHAEMSLSGVTL